MGMISYDTKVIIMFSSPFSGTFFQWELVMR